MSRPEEARHEGEWAFFRVDHVEHARKKMLLDCGHWIDGSEPYRRCVGRLAGSTEVWERTDCEFCSRADSTY